MWQNDSAFCSLKRIDRRLKGRGVIGTVVAFGAKVRHVNECEHTSDSFRVVTDCQVLRFATTNQAVAAMSARTDVDGSGMAPMVATKASSPFGPKGPADNSSAVGRNPVCGNEMPVFQVRRAAENEQVAQGNHSYLGSPIECLAGCGR
jgi:hypothetical protein